ncbi:MAG TPA: hypothetical protein VE077_10015 [Candidatus Methylomirabilis sp.]|nr:hypothetical protein [Candidatus Methylomirabilis sp.]
MSVPPGAASGALDLPFFSLDVEALDLGPGVKAVGLELIETESREPVGGKRAAEIWSSIFPALADDESLAVDFFSHVDRVAEFCKAHEIAFREAGARCLVVAKLRQAQLMQLFERFSGETFGVRVGEATERPDTPLEVELSKRGLDAYQAAYERYTFCAVCEPAVGWVTLLSAKLWASEVIRRIRPAVQAFDLYIARPH